MVWHFLDTIDVFGKKEKKINWLNEILPYFFGFLVCKPIHCFYTERMLQKEKKLHTALYLHKFWFLPTIEEGVTGVLICAAYMNIQQTGQPQTQLCILKFLKTALVFFCKTCECLFNSPPFYTLANINKDQANKVSCLRAIFCWLRDEQMQITFLSHSRGSSAHGYLGHVSVRIQFLCFYPLGLTCQTNPPFICFAW